MKKVLMGTSAIALTSAFATSAYSADWNVRVGGYHNQMVAYSSTDVNGSTADVDGVDVKQNAEIHFLPSITLDNGLKFGANVQLESNGSGDRIDESFMFIKGSFGELLLGSENSAGYKMHYAAPNRAIIAYNSPSTPTYIPWTGAADSGATRGTMGATSLEVARNNDSDRITYFTPRFAGFQVGASYARDGNQDDNTQQDVSDAGGQLHDIFDVGVNYVNDFGGVNVAVSARYGTATQENGVGVASTTPTALAFGANVGFGGFTIGGSWAEQNETGVDGTAYDVGVAYDTGPWGFSALWFHGESGADEQDTYGIGINYKLAKGVKLNGFGAYVDFDNGGGDVGDADGFVIGTGIGLSF